MEIKLIKRLTADNKNAKNILVIGVFHGDEEQGEFFINKFLKEKTPSFSTDMNRIYTQNAALKTGNAARLEAIKNAFDEAFYKKTNPMPQRNNLYYIPRLNPEKTRVNSNGVDLNRNFPTKNWELTEKDEYFGGVSPACEEETKFLISLIDEIKFDAIVSIHAPYKVVNYDGDAGGRALELAHIVSEITEYPIQKEIGYETPGSFGTYAGVEKDIPTITLEVDEEIPPEEIYPKIKKLFLFLEDEY